MKKETWKLILQLILSIITAIATTLGVTSCYIGVGWMKEGLGSSALRAVTEGLMCDVLQTSRNINPRLRRPRHTS